MRKLSSNLPECLPKLLTRAAKSVSFCRTSFNPAAFKRKPMPKVTKAGKAKKPKPSSQTEYPPSARPKLHHANVRLSHHKARGRWFQARSAWPVREAPVHMLIRERERAAKSVPPVVTVNSSWECVGPTNIGGRITSL